MNLPIALQLYTLREELKEDFVGILEKVSELGYNGVEFAGFGEMKAEELKNHLDRLGLKAAGSHTGLHLLRDKLEEIIEYNLIIENPYIVVPYAEYADKNDFLKIAGELSEIAAILNDKGLKLCYHNHAHEFEKFDGEYGLDLIYRNISSDLLKMEIDTYWVKKAGLNPVLYMDKYSGRIPMVHLKDMEEGTGDFAEVGEGIIDIKAIIDKAENIASEWLIVEQDKCKRPALESVEISINNLKELLN